MFRVLFVTILAALSLGCSPKPAPASNTGDQQEETVEFVHNPAIDGLKQPVKTASKLASAPVGNLGAYGFDKEPRVETEESYFSRYAPVVVSVKSTGGKLTYSCLSDGESIEDESYILSADVLAYAGNKEETLQPAVPIFKSAGKVGDKADWKGNYLFMGQSVPASAKIETSSDVILGNKPYDCLKVTVTLHATTQEPKGIDRTFIFWANKDAGLIQMQTKGASFRRPRANQAGDEVVE